MEKLIKLDIVVPQPRLMKCVYKITFGHRFYVGRTKNLSFRVAQHERGINFLMNNYADISTNGYKTELKRKQVSYYKSTAQFLLENPKITTGKVEVLQRALTNNELYFAENKYLRELDGNRDCLNKAFNASKPKRSEKYTLWDVVKIGNVFYYYDHCEPEIFLPHYYNLINGKISVPRTI